MEKQDFDIWTDADGKYTATVAVKAFVGDSDAPYGYCKHDLRVSATSPRDARSQYAELKKKAA